MVIKGELWDLGMGDEHKEEGKGAGSLRVIRMAGEMYLYQGVGEGAVEREGMWNGKGT